MEYFLCPFDSGDQRDEEAVLQRLLWSDRSETASTQTLMLLLSLKHLQHLFVIESNHGISGPNGHYLNSIIWCTDSNQNVDNAVTGSFWSLFWRAATIWRWSIPTCLEGFIQTFYSWDRTNLLVIKKVFNLTKCIQ